VFGRTVVLVDDGIATGATVRAAVQALRESGARKLILAVPVAPADTLAEIDVDETICLDTPDPFYAVGEHYLDFRQVSDEEVVKLLEANQRRRGSSHGYVG
jgi:putative phosphoribosyl transferase